MNQKEYTLVASVLKYPEMIPDVVSVVGPGDLTEKKLSQAFSTILDLWKASKPIDFLTVFSAGGGDAAFLAGMNDAITTKANITHYAAEVAKESWSRGMKSKLQEIANEVGVFDPADTIGALSGLVAEQTHLTDKSGDIVSVIERFKAQIDDTRKNGAGLPTGFDMFDRRIFALCSPGKVTAVGGFTSAGKTAFAVESVCRLHEQTPLARTVIISTEMSETQVVARIIARMTEIPTHAILGGRLTGIDFDKVKLAREWLVAQNIQIHDSVYDLSEMEAVIRQAHLRNGVDKVVVDYLQNITVKGAKSEYEQHDTCAKAFQRIAKSNNTNIMVLSQFSNDFAKNIADANTLEYKGGGTLAAVCDVGIVLFRSKQVNNLLMCDVRKHRHGRLGCQALSFEGNWTRLDEVQHERNQ